jgi:hypothetical protein
MMSAGRFELADRRLEEAIERGQHRSIQNLTNDAEAAQSVRLSGAEDLSSTTSTKALQAMAAISQLPGDTKRA